MPVYHSVVLVTGATSGWPIGHRLPVDPIEFAAISSTSS